MTSPLKIEIVWHTYNIFDFFFTTQQYHAYVTQSGLKRPLHVTRDLSCEPEFRCRVCVSQFHCGNEVQQGYKVQTNKL